MRRLTACSSAVRCGDRSAPSIRLARELKRYGVWWEPGNVWLAVNTDTASVEDIARTAPELKDRLVLKNAFGEGYFVYEPLSADVVEKLGGSSRTEKLRWLNGQSMRRMIRS